MYITKHEHQYKECFIKYNHHTMLKSYCTICGRIDERLDNSIAKDYFMILENPDAKFFKRIYTFIPNNRLYEKFKNKIPTYYVEDYSETPPWRENYINKNNKYTT